MSTMDSDCDSDSYGDNDYYDDIDYYDDDAYSIDSCYQYDDNSIVSSPSYASDSSGPRKSTSWDYDSDDEHLLLSSPLQDEKTYDSHKKLPYLQDLLLSRTLYLNMSLKSSLMKK